MRHKSLMMRPVAFILGAGVVLGACAPLNTYYKPGASVALVQSKTIDCQVIALGKVPVATQIVREPGQFVPERRICNASGQCRITGGYFVPGAVYTIDPNENLRARVVRQCMADAGFAPVSIPACPDAVARAAPSAATTRLPELTETSCVIRNPNGSFQIVNRG